VNVRSRQIVLRVLHRSSRNIIWRREVAAVCAQVKQRWFGLSIARRCRWCFSTASAQYSAGCAKTGMNDRSRQIVLRMLHRGSREIIWRREVAAICAQAKQRGLGCLLRDAVVGASAPRPRNRQPAVPDQG